MKKIGLIGGSGCGKSSVAAILTELGLSHIDCDVIARHVVEPGMPCLDELVSHFGCEILREDGSLNRQQLAKLAFSQPEQTQALNRITHKYILAQTDRQIAQAESKLGVVVDAAALAESGYLENCDCVIAVVAPKYKRMQRIMRRDGIGWIAARRRLHAQKSDRYYRSYADHVIVNTFGMEHLKKKTREVFGKIFPDQI